MDKPTPTSNPLLVDSPFPLFDEVKAEDVVPGITQLLDDLNATLDDLEKKVEPTWSGLVEPLERLTDRLSLAWGTVSHLKAVKDSEALRKAVEEVQPLQVKFGLRLSQSRPLYEGFRALREGPEWDSLSEARRRIVESELRDFVLGGVALEGEEKERFNEIKQELSQISTKFSNNLLDATKAFKKLIKDKTDINGLPDFALALAAQQAKAEGHEDVTPEEGPWLFTLDAPSFQPVLTHVRNRPLREELYRAYLTRASSGETDNTPLIERTLALRQEQAQLLGYPNYAEVSLASKMATLERAEGLLEELRGASYAAAVKDMGELKAFAAEHGHEGELRHWDMAFWAERLREAKYNIKDEQLRPYFALPNVLNGLFQLVEELFGVTIERTENSHTWHPDVQFYSLKKDGKQKAFFYLDPYSRPAEKRGGAWMDEVVGQSRLMAPAGESVRLPVGHMVCNQTPPVGDQPSLMTFREVETLFHEAGHCLQHMLTEQDEGLVSGIRGIEWDAVELPSQFMENWCYHRDTLNSFARHYESNEALPEDLYQKLVAARTYRSGSDMLRQLHFSELDLVLHSRYRPQPGATVFDSEEVKRVAERTTILKPLPEDRFLCGFSHIFAGGYAAGYFSYKWAEVLSADAFSAFEEAGLEDRSAVRETGRRFRDTVLALGGGRAPADVFKDFRGREPSTEPLLRHNDLLQVA
ncbi:hypothetical protein CVIRNUC_009586 [Coccomyxa viridis]|uniref:oligopeptidase A n=1 Tax=Coccomyxa viridis TaxID=1274662 RepID=A0AAV1IKD2_9CHLO|nr:hypothetical protein CVIRNUC_009586 [Coccomyxa viridis]